MEENVNSDVQYMSESEARQEIESIEKRPEFISPGYNDKVSESRTALVTRRQALYDRLYPPPEREDDDPRLAEEPSADLVNTMREGLALRREKERTDRDERDERTSYLLDLVESNDLVTLCDELAKDIEKMGATRQEIEVVRYFQSLAKDVEVPDQARDIAADFITLVYGIKRHGKGKR